MSFGAIVSGNAGSIVLSPTENNLVTTENVSLKSAEGIVTAATFEVNDGIASDPGTMHYFTGYSISLPTAEFTLMNENGESMLVNNFTSTPSGTENGVFINGKSVITVGATLHVKASQGLGKYSSNSPFPVTVNFH